MSAIALPSFIRGNQDLPASNAGQGAGSPADQDSPPTPVSERVYDETSLYGPTGAPQATDIQQNSLANCYFVATLGAFANEQPGQIEQAIDYNEETGNFEVTLYVAEPSGPFGWGSSPREVTIEVTQQELADNIARGGGSTLDNGNSDGALWPAVMEVAYAKTRDGNWSDGLDQGYGEMDYGPTSDAVYALTGSSGDALGPGALSMFPPEAQAEIINNALAGHVPVTISTTEGESRSIWEWATGQDVHQDGLADNHVFIVEGARVEDGEVVLTLRNPWAHNNNVGEGADTSAPTIDVNLSDMMEDAGFGEIRFAK